MLYCFHWQLVCFLQQKKHWAFYVNHVTISCLALVKMKTKAVLNKDVSLACEAHQDWVFPAGMYCVVTGWGVTTEGRSTSIVAFFFTSRIPYVSIFTG